MNQNIYTYITAFLFSCLVMLCASPAHASYSTPHPDGHHATRSAHAGHARGKTVRKAAIEQFHHWQGTRYRWGGTTHHGIDCSALMQKIVPPILGEHLPRTTSAQITKGKHVSRSALRPGDLVFFRTSPGQKHVGLYIGNNEFINSSSSKGVIISSLNNVYWRAHYLTARRLNSVSNYYRDTGKRTLLADNTQRHSRDS